MAAMARSLSCERAGSLVAANGCARAAACRRAAFVVAAIRRAEPERSDKFDALLDLIKWDDNGLVVAVAQDVDTAAVLMQAFANRDAVSATLASNRATFYSRSRNSLWTKGETSANFINVVDVYLDCDRDSVIYLGKPDGPACHTGARTCYFTRASDILGGKEQNADVMARSTLLELEATIQQRKTEPDSGKPSWTKRLLRDPKLLCSKIREEAGELCQTVEANEGKDRTVSEMADLLYHSMVLLASQDVQLSQVLETLRDRFRQSGVTEKEGRRKV